MKKDSLKDYHKEQKSLKPNNPLQYYNHYSNIKSDSIHVYFALKHLLGNINPNIIDINLVDVSKLLKDIYKLGSSHSYRLPEIKRSILP